MRIGYLIFIFLCIILLNRANAANDMQLDDAGFVLEQFQTSGMHLLRSNSGNREKMLWRVHGREALVQQPLYNIITFTMNMKIQFQGEYLIESPYCQFNKETKEVHSTAAIQVTGQGMSLTGIGYDIYWQKNKDAVTIVVRSAARLVIGLNP